MHCGIAADNLIQTEYFGRESAHPLWKLLGEQQRNQKTCFNFAPKNNVLPQCEYLKMSAENANAALQRIQKNLPRYRVVLVTEED